MAKDYLSQSILDYLWTNADGVAGVRADRNTGDLGEARATINRHLAKLVAAGGVVREGIGPATSARVKGVVA